MRLKAGKKDKLKFKKVIDKTKTGTQGVKKMPWRNEVNIWILTIGERFQFRGLLNNLHQEWESKDIVESFSVNVRGIKVETKTQAYFFDFVKEVSKIKEKPTAADLKALKDSSEVTK